MPPCFGARRVGAGQQRAPLRVLRAGGPDLLAGDAPAAVDLGGLGRQAGQVGTRARLGKQLAPDHLAAEGRRQEALLLLVGAVGDDRRDDPGGDAHLRPLHLPGRELLGDDDLLDRLRRPGPTAWAGAAAPSRPRRSRCCARRAESLSAQPLPRGSPRAASRCPGRGRCRSSACPVRGGGVDHLLRVVGGPAEAGGEHDRAPVVDVGVVLPGEADAAVHLDAVLRAVLRGDGGQRGGDRGGELESAVVARRRASSMARAASHTAAVARSVSAIMPAHLCLMAWNWPIGLPNCSRILAYSDAVSVAQRATPMHSADSSVDIRARAQRAAQVGQHAVVADLDGVGAHVGQRAQRVDALDGLDLELVGVEDDPLLAAVDRRRAAPAATPARRRARRAPRRG